MLFNGIRSYFDDQIFDYRKIGWKQDEVDELPRLEFDDEKIL